LHGEGKRSRRLQEEGGPGEGRGGQLISGAACCDAVDEHRIEALVPEEDLQGPAAGEGHLAEVERISGEPELRCGRGSEPEEGPGAEEF